MDLSSIDLTGANLTGVELFGATLTNPVLTDAMLTDAHPVRMVDCLTASMPSGDHYCVLDWSDLSGAPLGYANVGPPLNLSGLTLEFLHSDLTDANPSRSNPRGP